MNTRKHITARINRETAERLARTTAAEDRSQSSIVRRALREHSSGAITERYLNAAQVLFLGAAAKAEEPLFGSVDEVVDADC